MLGSLLILLLNTDLHNMLGSLMLSSLLTDLFIDFHSYNSQLV